MSWQMVPLSVMDFGFFDRQRDLFGDWVEEFDDDWRTMDMDSSRRTFDMELEKIKRDMFKLDTEESMLNVDRPFISDHIGNKKIKRDMFKLDTEESMLNVDRPFISDHIGNRKMALRFDCSQFKPEEIKVHAQNQRLYVKAKHEEQSPGNKVYREFTREYTLPQNVDPLTLKSTLSKDGVLEINGAAIGQIEAPREFLIPIEKL